MRRDGVSRALVVFCKVGRRRRERRAVPRWFTWGISNDIAVVYDWLERSEPGRASHAPSSTSYTPTASRPPTR